MFQKQTVKIFSIIAIVLSIIGLLLSVVGTLVIKGGSATLPFFLAILSWAILLWASVIAFKLCTSYKLEEELYKKIGIRVYAIILSFILFFFVGLIFGLVLSIAIFVTLWALKSNYDDWEKGGADLFLENDVKENK